MKASNGFFDRKCKERRRKEAEYEKVRAKRARIMNEKVAHQMQVTKKARGKTKTNAGGSDACNRSVFLFMCCFIMHCQIVIQMLGSRKIFVRGIPAALVVAIEFGKSKLVEMLRS